MSYWSLKRTYSKDDAKVTLAIYKKCENILIMYINTLKFKYTDIEYESGKVGISSAVIGKELYIYNISFKLPREYEER